MPSWHPDTGADTPDLQEGSLGRQVRQARARAFTGRRREVEVLSAALRGDPGSASVFFVYGPGGIGKSALLRWVAREAAQRGRPVVEVDGRFVGRSTGAFESAAARVTEGARAVLLVDTFEECQVLETWLRDRYLPRLPHDVLVVLAGQEPPELEWSTDSGWSGILQVLPLEPLSRDDAGALLSAHGLPPSIQDAILRFAGGNPLTLSLAVAVAAAPHDHDVTWAPSAEVLRTLLSRLVGEVPSTAHRQALEVTALAFTMTEALLRAALPEEDASALFDWLRELPYIESLAHGLHPHDAVREALIADLRWRDASAFDAMRSRLTTALLRRVREVTEHEARAIMSELMYLYRDVLTAAYTWDAAGQVVDGPLTPDDLPFASAMTRAAEGDDSAALVRFWYDRQPTGFSLYRSVDTGEPLAFSARLLLAAPADPEEVATDPVVAAAWEHTRRTGPVADGERIAITRFTVHATCYQQPSAVTSIIYWRALAVIARAPELTHGFLVYRDADLWGERFGETMRDTGARPVVGGTPYALFSNDWRTRPFEPWLREAAGATPARTEPEVRAGALLDKDEFGDAVRQALLLWRTPGGLAASRLATALVSVRATAPAATGEAEDGDAIVRAAVRAALDDMRAEPRTLRGHDAVEATYLSGARTQQAAARRLSLPFSTYRRHLKLGLAELVERLWATTT